MKKLFLSKYTFCICGGIALFFWAFWGALSLTAETIRYDLLADAVIYVALIAGLFLAYDKNETNIQKALIGALFMLLIKSNLSSLQSSIEDGVKYAVISLIVTLVLSVLIFIVHISLQSDHVGANKSLFMNQLCGVVIAVQLVLAFLMTINKNVSMADYVYIPAWSFSFVLLICIETRIQEYKKLRAEALEKGNWNEEARAEAKKIFKL